MMQVGSVVTVTGQVTFGRDAAMFEDLLSFVAQLSVVLWALVTLTLAIRFVGIFVYRRAASRTALVGAAAPGATVPPTTTIDEITQPIGGSDTVAAGVRVPHRTSVFAASSTEA